MDKITLDLRFYSDFANFIAFNYRAKKLERNGEKLSIKYSFCNNSINEEKHKEFFK